MVVALHGRRGRHQIHEASRQIVMWAKACPSATLHQALVDENGREGQSVAYQTRLWWWQTLHH